jgi:hypothetical protein
VWVGDLTTPIQGVVSEHVPVLVQEEAFELLVWIDSDQCWSTVAVNFIVFVTIFEAFEQFGIIEGIDVYLF